MDIAHIHPHHRCVRAIQMRKTGILQSLFAMLLMACSMGLYAGQLTINLSSAQSGNAIVEQRIDVYELHADGSKKWKARENTDISGKAVFELEGLGEGNEFVAQTTAYSDYRYTTEPITQTGDLNIALGSVAVKLRNGSLAGKPPMPETRVDINRLVDGKRKWFGRAKTDSNGYAYIDLPGLDSGEVYILKANSTVNGDSKLSREIHETGNHEFVVGNPALSVVVKDDESGQPIQDEKITVYRLAEDGKLKWTTRKTTDAEGKVVFDLDGIDTGEKFQLHARVFNNFTAKSDYLTQSGSLTWRLGTLRATLTNSSVTPAQPLAEHEVIIQLQKDDGKFGWFGKAWTDATGELKLNLNGMDDGAVYRLMAKSTVDGSYKYSEPFDQNGVVEFAVGNTPLLVSLRDDSSGQPLKELEVTAYEVVADGSLKWHTRKTTDANGRAVFDLLGLGEGTKYRLKTKAYSDQWIYSEILEQPGDLEWRAGKVRVAVMDGSVAPMQPLAGQKVTIEKLKGDGKYGWFSHATTNTAGLLKIDLPDLPAGAVYRLRAASPVNGAKKYSEPISENGDYQFAVGNTPLSVTLLDDKTGQPLADQKVTAYQILDDGSKQWRAHQTTDAEGFASFDLEGLGEGQQYLLQIRAFNSFTYYSDKYSQPGVHTLRLGQVRVEVLDGSVQPFAAMPEVKVTIEQLREDNKFKWFAGATTDADGKLKIDLPGFNDGAVYRLRAASPVNGANKYSGELTKKGDFQFIVGNTPLNATLLDDASGQPLVEQKVTAYEILEGGDKQWRAHQTTDSQGNVSFDLDGLGAGRNYVLQVRAFNGFTYYTEKYSEPGTHTLRIGKVRVSVLNGSTEPPSALQETKVTVQRLDAEGKFKWYAGATTDSDGKIKIDLPDTDNGATYRLAAKSQLTGHHKYSDPIMANGDFTFVVGNPALNVLLKNATTGTQLVGEKVTVYEFLDDGSKKWITRSETDDQGAVVFDLDGISQGRQYRLYVKPYDAGHVYSSVVQAYGVFDFQVGTVPVTLFNTASQSVITDKDIHAYLVQPDGNLKWAKKGTSNAEGLVLFDLEGLGTGETYVLKTHNPFGQNKRYYSSVISQQGPYLFEITDGDTQQPDVEPPQVAVLSPDARTTVPAEGFLIAGTATDNQAVSRVSVMVSAPDLAPVTGDAELNGNGAWQFSVAPENLVALAPLTIEVTAYDAVNNSANVTLNYQVAAAVTDQEAPVVAVTSHQTGDTVNKTGVTIRGTATDDVGVTELLASVTDPALGVVINAQPLSVDAQTGEFVLVIRNGQMTVGENITIDLLATDGAQRQGSASLTLVVQEVSGEPVQMLSRLTFGATPELVEYIQSVGPDMFLAEQLNPELIDNSAFEASLPSGTPDDVNGLKEYTLRHMLYSRRQLQEVMTWFWDNHFNTSYSSHGSIQYEIDENSGFRQHALGRFRDLLEVSAKSPAMIYYLNNAENNAGSPNENYAREIMELHTLGVDGGYTSADVAALARIFTGWHVQNDVFFFNAGQHNFEDKFFLGQTIVGSGLAEGEEALDILASHPSTANYLCTKLVQLFVMDTPTDVLVNDCADTFLANDGNIASVVERLVLSPEFSDPGMFRNKIKTPLEMITSVVRNFSVSVDYRDLDSAMRRMGMNLYYNSVPTGWSEIGEDWINTNLLLQRTRFVNDVAYNTNPSNDNYIDIRTQMLELGLQTPEAIVAHLLLVAMGGDYTELEYQIGVDVLNQGTEPFDINASDAETRLRRMLGHILSYPGYQFQ